MKITRIAIWILVAAIPLQCFPAPDLGDGDSHAPDVSLGSPALNRTLDHVYAKLQPLFQKYYPKATSYNAHSNGIHFEFDVTNFEFPYTGPPGRMHEATTQRGPNKGGILCSVYLEKGKYAGQAVLDSQNSKFGSALLDKNSYKEQLIAPYSAKRNVHLWVALFYPSDTNEEFLKEFRAIMKDFSNDED